MFSINYRYPLFFRDLLKHTPKSHRNYKLIEIALESVRGTAEKVNDYMRKSTTQSKMFEIASMCEEVEDLMHPDRRFILDIAVEMKSEGKTKKEKNQLFLFNDLILLLKDR